MFSWRGPPESVGSLCDAGLPSLNGRVARGARAAWHRDGERALLEIKREGPLAPAFKPNSRLPLPRDELSVQARDNQWPARVPRSGGRLRLIGRRPSLSLRVRGRHPPTSPRSWPFVELSRPRRNPTIVPWAAAASHSWRHSRFPGVDRATRGRPASTTNSSSRAHGSGQAAATGAATRSRRAWPVWRRCSATTAARRAASSPSPARGRG
jgi:hypothetical protein